MSVDELKNEIKNSSMITLMQPSSYIKLDELPKLASGKTDFAKAKILATTNLAQRSE